MKKLAFVIEDNNDISNLFFRALIEADFQVEMISRGEVALARLQHERPTLVILDLHLPDVSGETLLAYIRTAEHLKDTKVIIATADAMLGELHGHKADLLLEKPISYAQMRDFAMRFKD